MLKYLMIRLGESALAIWGVVTIVFVVSRMIGDPAALLLPVGVSEAELTAVRSQLGLDQPLPAQYGKFLLGVVQGDFGQSYQFMRPARQVVLERMPATMTLAFSALFLGLILGVIAGSVAALRHGTVTELIVMLIALVGQATPVFWLGTMFILFFAVDLRWFPTGGNESVGAVVLPAATLAMFTSASIARLLRSSILEVLRDDHVRTAHAKGLMPSTVFFWHVGRNSLIPVVTLVAILTGELLGGSVVTETVFTWPGVGRLIMQAIEANDFPVVQAGVTMIATVFVTINLLVDVLYGILDPRISRR